MVFGFIDWNVDPVLFSLGNMHIRYYSLFFALAFWLGYVIMQRMFRHEGVPDIWCDKIFIYTIVATIIGSRLGHVFFYGWDYYSQHPAEIIKVWEGGLASHGGAIGILIALLIYKFRVARQRSYLWVMDHIVVPTALAAFFIRMGNLMNSEIYGQPTDVPWAFRFLRLGPDAGMIPRHPSQIYEALAYLIVFGILVWLYQRKKAYQREGMLFGTFLIGIFGFRLFVETMKANQEAFEEGMTLNMGQLLSIPFIVAGITCLVFALKNKRKELPAVK